MVLDKSQKLRDRRGRIAGGATMIEMGLRVEKGQEIMADLDVRKLVRRVQIALAMHFSDSLLAGIRPDSGRALPKLSKATTAFGPRAGGFGVRTGKTARGWMFGKISGHPLRARGKVFPTRDPEFLRLAVLWLARPDPVDLMAIDGGAKDVIEETFQQWADDAFGAGVATESRAKTAQGSIDKLR